MSKQIKAVVFDHDGTLVETESGHFGVWHALLAELGVDFTEQEYLQDCNGLPSIENARMLVDRYPITWTANVLLAEKEKRAREYFSNNLPPLMPKLEQCLRTCQLANLQMAIATGASFDTIKAAVGKRDFYQYFHNISTADEVKNNKPAPDVYRLAYEKMGLTAEHCVAVEDSPTGVAAAKAAGLYCIAVPSAYSRFQDLSLADHQVSDLLEAAELIVGFCQN